MARWCTPPTLMWSLTCTGYWHSADSGRACPRRSPWPRSTTLASPGISARHRARLQVLAARTYGNYGEVEKAGQAAATALGEASEIGDSWAMGWALHVL